MSNIKKLENIGHNYGFSTWATGAAKYLTSKLAIFAKGVLDYVLNENAINANLYCHRIHSYEPDVLAYQFKNNERDVKATVFFHWNTFEVEVVFFDELRKYYHTSYYFDFMLKPYEIENGDEK